MRRAVPLVLLLGLAVSTGLSAQGVFGQLGAGLVVSSISPKGGDTFSERTALKPGFLLAGGVATDVVLFRLDLRLLSVAGEGGGTNGLLVPGFGAGWMAAPSSGSVRPYLLLSLGPSIPTSGDGGLLVGGVAGAVAGRAFGEARLDLAVSDNHPLRRRGKAFVSLIVGLRLGR